MAKDFEYVQVLTKKDDPNLPSDPNGWRYAHTAGYFKCTDGKWRNPQGDLYGMDDKKTTVDLKVKYHEYIIWNAIHGKALKEIQSW